MPEPESNSRQRPKRDNKKILRRASRNGKGPTARQAKKSEHSGNLRGQEETADRARPKAPKSNTISASPIVVKGWAADPERRAPLETRGTAKWTASGASPDAGTLHLHLEGPAETRRTARWSDAETRPKGLQVRRRRILLQIPAAALRAILAIVPRGVLKRGPKARRSPASTKRALTAWSQISLEPPDPRQGQLFDSFASAGAPS